MQKQNPHLLRRALLLGGLTLPFLARRAAGQATWPNGPVRFVVPFAPGGTSDFLSRLIAQRLAEKHGGSFLVENRTGAAGGIAAAAVSRERPDGGVLIMADNSFASGPALRREPPLDPVTDLVPVTKVVEYPALLLAGPRLPVRTLQEFLAHPRTRAGQIDYGSGGNGSAPHLAMELFADVAGIRMNHIGYRGMAQAMTDLVGGRIDLAISVVPTVRPMLQAPGVVVLAVATSGARVPAVAQVPSAREQGVDFVLGFWFGLMGPRGLDPTLAARIREEVAAVVQAPDIRARLEEQGGVVAASDPAAFRAEITREMQLWNRLVPEKGITL